MVALQIISKIIATGDFSIVEDNLLTEDYFTEYEEEFKYIQEHYRKYGNVPDRVTFLSHFDPEGKGLIELVEVTESDQYLVDTIKEEWLYAKSVPVVQKIADLLKTDSNAAVEYMIQSMVELRPQYKLGGTDIIAEANVRYDTYKERREHEEAWTFTTGFKELDDIVHGIERQEELVLLFARINQGKSWVLEKICAHIWQIGFNVGYISPEMSANSVGYRFDTLYKHFSNQSLLWANEDTDEAEYKKYIDKLQKKENKFIVATPMDFDKKITVSKLKKWVQQYSLDVIAIDGVTYMTDERAKRGDTKSIMLTNIGEDLMSLSIEMKIPVLIVCQANRGGVIEEAVNDTPELENIKDSDGLAANASKVFSLRQTKEGVLKIGIKKQRFGVVGGQLNYQWNADIGEFIFVPSYDDAEDDESTEHKVKHMRKKMQDKEDVF